MRIAGKMRMISVIWKAGTSPMSCGSPREQLRACPDLAVELVVLMPAVIVAGSAPAALAVRNITRTIPVVMNTNQDPMAIGLAVSMARPGRNVTGIWLEGDQVLIGKRLE